jgi:hypothetical protein
MPSTHVKFDQWNIPDDIQLADPAFYKPRPIDLLLGAELFFRILHSEKKLGQETIPRFKILNWAGFSLGNTRHRN